MFIIDPYRFASAGWSGNLGTWNPSDKTSSLTLSGGNLTAANISGSTQEAMVRAQYYKQPDNTARYFETVCGAGTHDTLIGIASAAHVITNPMYSSLNAIGLLQDGRWFKDSLSSPLSIPYSPGDVIGCWYDGVYVWWHVNGGSWNGSGTADPASVSGGVAHTLYGRIYPAVRHRNNNTSSTVRFDPSSWSYPSKATGATPITDDRVWPSAVTWAAYDKNANVNLSGSDLVATAAAVSGEKSLRATHPGSPTASQKTYFEVLISTSATEVHVGIAQANFDLRQYVGQSNSVAVNALGNIYKNGSIVGGVGSSLAAGDVIRVSYDATSVWIARNAGNWNNSGTADPATNAGGIAHSLTGDIFPAGRLISTGPTITLRALSSAWGYSAPSGFAEVSSTYLT